MSFCNSIFIGEVMIAMDQNTLWMVLGTIEIFYIDSGVSSSGIQNQIDFWVRKIRFKKFLSHKSIFNKNLKQNICGKIIYNKDGPNLCQLSITPFQKCKENLRICSILGKNPLNFLPPNLKFHNQYCHNLGKSLVKHFFWFGL